MQVGIRCRYGCYGMFCNNGKCGITLSLLYFNKLKFSFSDGLTQLCACPIYPQKSFN